MIPNQTTQLRQILERVKRICLEVPVKPQEYEHICKIINGEANSALALLPCQTCGDTGKIPTKASIGFGPENAILQACPDCKQPKDQQPSSEKDYSNSEFIKVQRLAAQLAIDAYEEDQEWCPTKTARLLDACDRLDRAAQQRKDLLEACKDALKKLNWPIYTEREKLSMKSCREKLEAAIAKAEKGNQ